MSDLAPFVAAVLNDKVAIEMKQEIDELRKQLRQCRAVEVTGPEGTPVYATGQFDENGRHGNNPNLWSVDLSEITPCNLGNLESVEVRIGGVCKAKFGNNSPFSGSLDPDDQDHDHGKHVNFCFAGGGELWLSVMVNGWPRERWQAAVDQEIDRNDNLFDYLLDTVEAEQPSKSISFLEVDFFKNSVNGAIQSLSSDKAMEDDEARERREQHMFVGNVAGRMRDAGYEGGPNVIMDQLSEVLGALNALGIDNSNVGANSETVDTVIDLHAQSRDAPGQRFEDHINRMITELNQMDEDNEE